MKYLLIIMVLFLFGCGKMNVSVTDSKHEMTVTMGFIDQMYSICEDLYPMSDFDNNDARNKAVAACTIERLSEVKLNASELAEYQDVLDDLKNQAEQTIN